MSQSPAAESRPTLRIFLSCVSGEFGEHRRLLKTERKTLAEQAQAVRTALAARLKPATAGESCKQFRAAKAERIMGLLATRGQARSVGGERPVA